MFISSEYQGLDNRLATDFAFILWFRLHFPQSMILCLGLFLLIESQNPSTPVLLVK